MAWLAVAFACAGCQTLGHGGQDPRFLAGSGDGGGRWFAAVLGRPQGPAWVSLKGLLMTVYSFDVLATLKAFTTAATNDGAILAGCVSIGDDGGGEFIFGPSPAN